MQLLDFLIKSFISNDYQEECLGDLYERYENSVRKGNSKLFSLFRTYWLAFRLITVELQIRMEQIMDGRGCNGKYPKRMSRRFMKLFAAGIAAFSTAVLLATFSSINFIRADLSGADLSGTDLSGNLSGANLSDANLSDANLSSIELKKANLSKAELVSANFIDTNLSNANLSSTNLSNAQITSTDLSGSDLSSTDLSEAVLNDTDLSGADLSGADLSSTDLSDIDLSGADLQEVKWDENISWKRVRGLNTAKNVPQALEKKLKPVPPLEK